MSETPPIAEFGATADTARMRLGTTTTTVNLRALKRVNSPVLAKVSPGVQVWCGQPENGMTPVRLEGWISSELVPK